MSKQGKGLLEFLMLYFHGFRPVEFVRGEDRVTSHASGWRVNGSGRFERAKDALAYVDSAPSEEWRQVYCGINLFLVSSRGNVKKHDGTPADTFYLNGRCQIKYQVVKFGRVRNREIYRSHLVAMAFLNYQKGDEREIHHINGYRMDDSVDNLVVLTREDHAKVHSYGPTAPSGPIVPEMPVPRQRATKEEKRVVGRHAGVPSCPQQRPWEPAPSTDGSDDEARAANGRAKRRGRKRGSAGRAEVAVSAADEAQPFDTAPACEAETLAATLDRRSEENVAAVEKTVETRACETGDSDSSKASSNEQACAATAVRTDGPESEAASSPSEAHETAAPGIDDADDAGCPAPVPERFDDAVGEESEREEGAGGQEARKQPARRRRGRRGGRRHRVSGASSLSAEADATPVAEADAAEDSAVTADAGGIAAEASKPAVEETPDDAFGQREAPASSDVGSEDARAVEEPSETEAAVSSAVESENDRGFDEPAEADDEFPMPVDVDDAFDLLAVETVVVDEVPSVSDGTAEAEPEPQPAGAPIADGRPDCPDEAQREAHQASTPAMDMPTDVQPSCDGACPIEQDAAVQPAHGVDEGEDDVAVDERAKDAAAELPQEAVSWDDKRAVFERELDQFLKGLSVAVEDGGEPASRVRGRQVKAVYRALRPFHSCDDAIAVFDLALSAVRRINQFAMVGDGAVPGVVVGLLSQVNQLLKSACERIAQGGDLERSCAVELLDEEASSPTYAKLGYDAKLRKCARLLAPESAQEGEGGQRPERKSKRRRPGKRERARRPLPSLQQDDGPESPGGAQAASSESERASEGAKDVEQDGASQRP